MLAGAKENQVKASGKASAAEPAGRKENPPDSTPLWQSLALRAPSIQTKSIANQAGGPHRSAAHSAAPVEHKTPASNSGGGRPLDTTTRAYFEERFGRDLRPVRVHTGADAHAAAAKIQANAFTVDRHITFQDGLFSPQTTEGKRLLAHELTHVIQQDDGLTRDRQPLALEHHADAVAARVTAGASAADLLPTCANPAGAAPAVQRDPDPRSQEAERAANEMWGVINDINALDAQVEFTYYVSNGAMTLVSYQQTKPGGKALSSQSQDQFKRDALGFKGGVATGSTLVTFVGLTDGYFTMTFQRDAAKWSMVAWHEKKDASLPSTPPEGRAQPNTASAGWPVDVFARVQREVAKWVPVIKAYPGGTAVLNMSVKFDDDRLTAMNLLSQTNSGGKGPAFAPAAAGTETMLINTILAFSQGLGERTIKFKLDGAAPAGETKWRVVSAETDRGPSPPLPDEAEVIVADYHRMHAEIIRKWREGVKDAAIYAGMFGAEQLAFWLIGGVVAKGLGAVFELAAPRLIQFIRLGSKSGSRAGIEYLETMVARLPIAEREEMAVLARKMETEGIEALGQAERKSLDRLLKKLESLIEAPLTTAEKDTLRGRMATRFGATKPGVDAVFQAAKRGYQIHHRMPLEWAHKFPGIDANAGKNLIGLETEVHKGVNAVWTRLRNTAPAGKVDGNVVSRVMDIVDKHFGKWYDVVPGKSGLALEAEVFAAKGNAYDAVAALVSKL